MLLATGQYITVLIIVHFYEVQGLSEEEAQSARTDTWPPLSPEKGEMENII